MVGIIRCDKTVEKHGNKAKVISIRGSILHGQVSGEEYPSNVIELQFPDGFTTQFYETDYNDIGILFEGENDFSYFDNTSRDGKHSGKSNIFCDSCYKNAFIEVLHPSCIIYASEKGKGLKKIDTKNKIVDDPLSKNREYTLNSLFCKKGDGGMYDCVGDSYFESEPKVRGKVSNVRTSITRGIDVKTAGDGSWISLKKSGERPFTCATKNDYEIGGDGMHGFIGKRLECSIVTLP